MRTHTIKVRGRRASIDDRTLVQGTVGEDVLALDLDEEWDGLVVTVAFKWQHGSSIVAKQVEGGYEVPWERNQQPGKVLIAVEGTKDGKVMRHATIGHPMVVLPSEEASGTSPTDPTVSEYRKVYEDVKLATATANGAADVKRRADSGEFKGEKGDKVRQGATRCDSSATLSHLVAVDNLGLLFCLCRKIVHNCEASAQATTIP